MIRIMAPSALVCWLFALMLAPVSLKAQNMSNSSSALSSVLRLITALEGDAIRDQKAVERILGIPLSPKSRTKAFTISTSGPGRFGSFAFKSVELRSTVAGGPATKGPMLIIETPTDPCIPRQSVLDAFPGHTLFDVPKQGLPQEQSSWSVAMEGGMRTILGFSVAAPDCLASITVALDAPN